MEKEFIPYEQALALKELGFDEPCFGVYITSQLFVTPDIVYNSKDIPICKAPLYQQAFRWFREKYGCCGYSNIHQYYISGNYFLNSFEKPNQIIITCKKWDEIELECLKEMIKIIKDGKK